MIKNYLVLESILTLKILCRCIQRARKESHLTKLLQAQKMLFPALLEPLFNPKNSLARPLLMASTAYPVKQTSNTVNSKIKIKTNNLNKKNLRELRL